MHRFTWLQYATLWVSVKKSFRFLYGFYQMGRTSFRKGGQKKMFASSCEAVKINHKSAVANEVANG